MEKGLSAYYHTCPFPKPGNKKKKKKTNGYKDKPNRICIYTGEPYAERHEVFFGNGVRQWAIDNGYQIDICPEIHRAIHAHTEEGNKINSYWQKQYQRLHETRMINQGMTEEEARADFMFHAGRNYL